jgi:TatD DNase family protein|tara:strand:- start:4012 stop:4770 length:759 start_codon:yes stop_codon:yes gene_type:complete
MLIDIHTHIQHFSEQDLGILIKNSRFKNIDIIVAAGTTLSDSTQALKLANNFKEIYAAVGIHPQNILDESTDDYLIKFERLIQSKKTIMVSEIGLDFQENSVDIKLQRKFFSEQINLAKNTNLPIAFHVRNAEKEAINIINSEKVNEIKSVAHYFSGSYEYAKKLLNNGIFISVAKPFLRNEELANTIKKLPLDRLVIETDSYPQYFKKNRTRWTEPKDLHVILEKLSCIFKKDKEEIKEIILKNTKYILNI